MRPTSCPHTGAVPYTVSRNGRCRFESCWGRKDRQCSDVAEDNHSARLTSHNCPMV